MEKLNIKAIKSNQGYFINLDRSYNFCDCLLFDGLKAERTFSRDWVKITSIPKRIYRLQRVEDTNHRYILVDPELASDKIPLELSLGEVLDTTAPDGKNCSGNYVWKAEYAPLRSLYTMVSNQHPPVEVDVEFAFDTLFEIGDIVEPVKFVHPKHSISATHQKLDEIIFPDVLLPQTPCCLSSGIMYDIIRNHIQLHIDPKVAVITSDYDFCFAVKKRIPIVDPYTNTWEEKGKRRKPIVRSKFINERQEVCFEMTYSPANYKGYTPIQPLYAANEPELKQRLDTYLEVLMAQINKPLKECACCKGYGVVEA